jgi:hypothetical protein
MSMQWKTPQAKAARASKPKGKPKEGDVDPRAMDRLIAESQKRHNQMANNGYGYTYSPETLAYAAQCEQEGEFLLASVAKTLERARDQRPHQAFLADLQDMDNGKELDSIESTSTTLTQDECQWEEDPDDVPEVIEQNLVDEDEEPEDEDEDSVELEVLGSLTPDASGKARTLCQLLFLMNGKSLPDLIAMSQGLYVRDKNDINFGGKDGLVFDLEGDELLKTCSVRANVLPKVVHLRSEAARRAALYKIKPLRKAAAKNELIAWLKLNPITDAGDIEFLLNEAGRTYRMILSKEDEAADAAKAALQTRNWTLGAHLRLYCAAMSNEARPYILTKDDVFNDRLEMDGRNSAKRPPTWHEKIAECYNSPREYVSLELPDLHIDMPGGPITAAQVKIRMGDAREWCHT